MQRCAAFVGSAARGLREPPKQSIDSRKVRMEGAPVQQRRIVLRGRGSRGKIRLGGHSARGIPPGGLLRYREQTDPGLPLRALLLEPAQSGGGVGPKTAGGPWHSTRSVTQGVS